MLTLVSKNDILISMKTKKGEKQMNTQKVEDVKDTALKLDEIRICRPEDYFYLKGWIHCLLQKEEEKSRQLRKPPMQIPQLQ
jgi:hypothetical protein